MVRETAGSLFAGPAVVGGWFGCLVVPAPIPAVPPVPVPVSVVMATPVVAVVVVISVMPVAVCAGHAAGEDLRYLHVVSSLGGETGFLRPMGGIALVSRKVTNR